MSTTTAAAHTTTLRWSLAWAEVVGADGPVITDLLGTRIPCMTETQRDQLRQAWKARYPVSNRAHHHLDQLREAADAHGLRAALAAALQSCDRALRTHITGPVGSDDWHRWMGITDPLRAVIHALVLRRVTRDTGALTEPWEQVMGALPQVDDLTAAEPGPDACVECGAPRGAQYVTKAEAARYARRLQSLGEAGVRAARESEDAMRARMRDWRGHYLPIPEVRDAVEHALSGVPASTRDRIVRRLEGRLPMRFDGEPGQPDLFTAGGAR